MDQCFTILWQQPGIQALQVLNLDKRWVNAPPIPGSLVIKYLYKFLSFISPYTDYEFHCLNSLGDQFARWSSTLMALFCSIDY